MLSFELRPLSVTLPFDGHCWDMAFPHRLDKANILLMFQNNLSTSKGDMERTRKVNGRTDGSTNGRTGATTKNDSSYDGRIKITIGHNCIKDGLPYLFHCFRNKYFYKISLGSMLYFQNKFTSFAKMHGFPINMQ